LIPSSFLGVSIVMFDMNGFACILHRVRRPRRWPGLIMAARIAALMVLMAYPLVPP
jgi:hypothetical protein